jgi:hypothetical protein
MGNSEVKIEAMVNENHTTLVCNRDSDGFNNSTTLACK